MKKIITVIIIILVATLSACKSSISDDFSSNNTSLTESESSNSENTHNTVSSFVSSEDKSIEDTKTCEQYEEFNKKYPVQGEKEWIFRSTDKDYIMSTE